MPEPALGKKSRLASVRLLVETLLGCSIFSLVVRSLNHRSHWNTFGNGIASVDLDDSLQLTSFHSGKNWHFNSIGSSLPVWRRDGGADIAE